jgi:GTP-binding protein
MLDFLADLGVPTIVAFTKIDKLNRAQATARVKALCDGLGLEVEQVVPFSSHTGEGRDELAAALMSLLALPDWRTAE